MEMEVHQGSNQLVGQTTYLHHPQQHHHIHVNHHHHHQHTILPIISSSTSMHFELPAKDINNSRLAANNGCSVASSSSCTTSPVLQGCVNVGMSPIKIPTCTSPELRDASRSAYFEHNQQQIFNGILRDNGQQPPTNETSSSQQKQDSVHKHLEDLNVVTSLSLVSRSISNDRKRPYPCNLCSSKFGSKMELEEHQNSHTGMKPFQCDICQSRFNRRSTLWNHKRIHNDAKPFVCNICTMTFKWKNSLKCHKEMHSRKNETNSVQDSDIRLLTYATAAKKCLGEFQCKMSEENPEVSSINNSSSSNLPFSGSARKRAPARLHKSFVKNVFFNSTDSKPLQLESLCYQQKNKQNDSISVIFSPKVAKSIKLENLTSDTTAVLESSGLLLNCSTEEFIRQQFSENGGFDVPMLPLSPSTHTAGLLSSPTMNKQQHCELSGDNNQAISTSGFPNTTMNGGNAANGNLHLDSSLFNCSNLQINACGQQTDLFSQLDHEHSKMPNFLDRNGCTSALNMRLPFLNFDLQQLNNSLVEQQSHHLQHSSSAFDSFNNLQHQQNFGGGSSFSIPTSFPSSTNVSTTMTNHSSAEMLLGGSLSYPGLHSTAILTAAAAAASSSSSDLGVDYFSGTTEYSTSLDNSSYSNNINSLLHQQQQLNQQTSSLLSPAEDPLVALMHQTHPHNNYLNTDQFC